MLCDLTLSLPNSGPDNLEGWMKDCETSPGSEREMQRSVSDVCLSSSGASYLPSVLQPSLQRKQISYSTTLQCALRIRHLDGRQVSPKHLTLGLKETKAKPAS